MKYEKAKSVASYLEAIPAERKPQLKKIISLIKKAAPGITEEYSHNMPLMP